MQCRTRGARCIVRDAMEGPKLCIERIIKRGNKVYKEKEEMRISRYTGKELRDCFSQPC